VGRGELGADVDAAGGPEGVGWPERTGAGDDALGLADGRGVGSRFSRVGLPLGVPLGPGPGEMVTVAEFEGAAVKEEEVGNADTEALVVPQAASVTARSPAPVRIRTRTKG
jgi:hypothetical protein